LGVIFSLCLCIPTSVFAMDTDNDGLNDELELMYATDVGNPDTDGDGYFDGEEVTFDYSPHCGDGKWMNECDFDNDGLNDWLERWFGSSLNSQDTDGDGYSDFDEVMRGYSPKEAFGESLFNRYIEVDRTTQRLYYYVDGVKVLNFPVSTGNPGTETPEGTFQIERMIAEKSYVGPGYDIPGVTWNMQFKPMYYIHTAFWHNDFGKKTHSHGCINLREKDAQFLYKYMDVGVEILVVGETPANYVVGS